MRDRTSRAAIDERPVFGALWLPKTPNDREKSRVFEFTAIVSSACLNMCVPSSPFLPADSVAGPFWN
jgi:hypothetical protein